MNEGCVFVVDPVTWEGRTGDLQKSDIRTVPSRSASTVP